MKINSKTCYVILVPNSPESVHHLDIISFFIFWSLFINPLGFCCIIHTQLLLLLFFLKIAIAILLFSVTQWETKPLFVPGSLLWRWQRSAGEPQRGPGVHVNFCEYTRIHFFMCTQTDEEIWCAMTRALNLDLKYRLQQSTHSMQAYSSHLRYDWWHLVYSTCCSHY